MNTIIDKIISVYVRESSLTATHGKFNEYLGTTIDFSKKGKIKFTKYDYISDMIEAVPEEINTGESETLDGDHLFTTK